ncbi:MAG: MarR family transcriptional regulator [Xanthomonadales bacterium]|nr:MarR family transcriptional regulator [Xanthomonadales bacterium]
MGMPTNWLALDKQLCFALYSASHAMTRAYQPLLAPLGLTYPQYLVMLVLWERDDQTVSAIGSRLLLDSATLTPLLKRMEQAGLLQRQRDRDDERQVRIALSDAGRALRRRARAVPVSVHHAVGCPPDEMHGLRDRLHDLRRQLDGNIQGP